MDIIDSSMITAYMRCPRYFYYRYVRDWQLEAPSLHLEFGTAWHLAKEALLQGKSLDECFNAFMSHYRSVYPAGYDEPNAPKNPDGCARGLAQYFNDYGSKPFPEVLHIEVGGVIPITTDTNATYRIDAVIKDDDGVLWVVDHKTASRKSAMWEDQWTLSIQMFVYITALEYHYGADAVGGAIIDGTFFRKNDCENLRINVRSKSPAHRNLYWTVAHVIDLINWNVEQLENATEDHLPAFHMNPNSCLDYGRRCEYHDFCTCWDCPHGKPCPSGFVVKKWNPLEEVEGKESLCQTKTPK